MVCWVYLPFQRSQYLVGQVLSQIYGGPEVFVDTTFGWTWQRVPLNCLYICCMSNYLYAILFISIVFTYCNYMRPVCSIEC